MKFEKKRSNILIIFEQLIEIPILIIVFIGLFIFLDEVNYEILSLLILILLSPISKFLKYLTTYYTINEKFLVITSGIINKKTQEIPLKSITTVDFSQNLLFQIFNVYKIKVENSSETVNKNNIVNLALKKEEALTFKELLLHKKKTNNIEKDNDEIIKIKESKFLIKSLLDSKIALIIVLISAISTIGFNLSIINKSIEIFGIVFSLIIIFIILYVSSTILYIISNFIKYFNFTIKHNKNSIIISYGLITKKTHTLKREKITGIVLKQSIPMKLFKYYTLEGIVIGYGNNNEDENNEKAIILPIGKLNEIKELLETLNIKYNINTKLNKCPKKSLIYFFITPYYLIMIILIILSIYLNNKIFIFISTLITFMLVISSILNYINIGIKSNKKNTTVSFGAFVKQICIVNTNRIESIESLGSYFKLNRNINTIKIGVFAPLNYKNLKISNVSINDYETLKNNLDY